MWNPQLSNPYLEELRGVEDACLLDDLAVIGYSTTHPNPQVSVVRLTDDVRRFAIPHLTLDISHNIATEAKTYRLGSPWTFHSDPAPQRNHVFQSWDHLPGSITIRLCIQISLWGTRQIYSDLDCL